ncbi:MAG: hypothetical protein FJ095_19390 [Deltaproteobacteria bacterium]|nr:hypothetical protein [Deltaproteobacteria bacterium]
MAFRCTSTHCPIAVSAATFPVAMPCPVCQGPLAAVEAPQADGSVPAADPLSTAASPALADALPTLLALPLRELMHEPSPVLALWAACDLVETALKFVVMAGVAEHVAASGKLPDALARELRDRVELPTMGKWLGMALAVAKHAPKVLDAPAREDRVRPRGPARRQGCDRRDRRAAASQSPRARRARRVAPRRGPRA